MGFTFQFPEEQFLRQTVREEFEDMMRLRRISPAEFPPRMNGALAAMGLGAGGITERSPFSLSLGEARRLGLALLLAIAPAAALLDEPTAGLDAQGFACALRAISSFRRTGATVIIATHDVNLLAETAARVLILGEGGIETDGEAERILSDGTLLGRFGYSVPEVVATAADLRAQGRIGGGPVLRLSELIERAGGVR
jgi:energy-coupling factor transporter ATP-binding protein EcfA2